MNECHLWMKLCPFIIFFFAKLNLISEFPNNKILDWLCLCNFHIFYFIEIENLSWKISVHQSHFSFVHIQTNHSNGIKKNQSFLLIVERWCVFSQWSLKITFIYQYYCAYQHVVSKNKHFKLWWNIFIN